MQVLPCAQIVAGQGTCQCEANNYLRKTFGKRNFLTLCLLNLNFGIQASDFKLKP